VYQNIGDLTFVQPLGSGSFGDVFLYKQNNSNKFYAVKMIDKNRAKYSKYFKYLNSELQALSMLNHPNIVKLKKVIDSQSQIHLLIVMEYCNGGSLLKCLENYINKYKTPFSEEIVQYLTRQIVEALAYIHDKNIIHRDLKLENIMVNFDNEIDKTNLNMMKAKIKIIDFGLSKVLKSKEGFATSLVGSPIYEDPKILEVQLKLKDIKNFQYSKEADIWSLGCICYEMVKGKKVFESFSESELITKIQEGKYKLPQTISREFISFLYDMLQYNGNLRLTAKQLLEKRFLRKDIKEFHYLNVNHDLKQEKEFLELKSSIKLYKERISKSYQKQMTFEKESPNLIQANNNILNNIISPNSYPNVNITNNSTQTFSINNGYSFYGQKMTPDNALTNSSSSSNTNFSAPNPINVVSNYPNPMPHSYGPNTNTNINPQQYIHRSMVNNNTIYNNLNNINNNNNNTNNNYPQSNNNSNMNPPLQRYNSEPINMKKDDGCFLF